VINIVSNNLGGFSSSNSFSNDDVLGVVLAGGLSSRMGQDKSLLPRGNASNSFSMVDFSKQLLSNAGINNIVVSGDNHQVHDLVKGAGPVGGIYSVLQYCLKKQRQPKALLILPVDLPLMTAFALKQLRMKGELSQKATFYADSSGKTHNIPLYLPNNAYLELFLAQAFKGYTPKSGEKNGPSIRTLLKKVPHQVITLANNASTNQILFNSNTPEEWQKAKQQF
jgi:molybdopterin-guanine dinucleotide biosynthesis protein A